MRAERVVSYFLNLKCEIAASDQVTKPSSAPARLRSQFGGEITLLLRTLLGDLSYGAGIPSQRAKLLLLVVVRGAANYVSVQVPCRLMHSTVELFLAYPSGPSSVLGDVPSGWSSYTEPAAHTERVHDALPE
ncbi:hypothetical protein C8N24_0265 [Solirubrobacter pauli]|uniref:Uncharacterized protein n=1 Tax=Solirubrobacter pauli TaxID=166793 RepID=A0A660L5Z1_9ACTN|nr:hypothetical protein [Solirubrobacter pauli]RKQ90462.1 hypothetical protein C8N24_0265 [Solirubrobacter pauli]